MPQNHKYLEKNPSKQLPLGSAGFPFSPGGGGVKVLRQGQHFGKGEEGSTPGSNVGRADAHIE